MFNIPSPGEKPVIYEPISLFMLRKRESFAPTLSLRVFFKKNSILNTLEIAILKDPQIKHFLKQQMFY